MCKVILSIKPVFADKIYSGDKIVELRKRVGKAFRPGTQIYIYSSSPRKEISGHARISKIEKTEVQQIRNRYLNEACISLHDFDSYYKNHQVGILIWLDDIVKYKDAIPLSLLRDYQFSPPQSYCYVEKKINQILEKTS